MNAYAIHSIGVGITTPRNMLHIHNGNGSAFIQITNQRTGSGDAYDGMIIGIPDNNYGESVIRSTYGRSINIQFESTVQPTTYNDAAVFSRLSETEFKNRFYGQCVIDELCFGEPDQNGTYRLSRINNSLQIDQRTDGQWTFRGSFEPL